MGRGERRLINRACTGLKAVQGTSRPTIRVTEPPPYRGCHATRTDGDDGCSLARLQVYAHDPSHVAAAVPCALTGSDGHGAARVKNEEADPGNAPSGRDRDCFIPLGPATAVDVNIANGENTITACCNSESNRVYNETAAQATALSMQYSIIVSCVMLICICNQLGSRTCLARDCCSY
jgi:hypothetical protein